MQGSRLRAARYRRRTDGIPVIPAKAGLPAWRLLRRSLEKLRGILKQGIRMEFPQLPSA